MSSPVVTRFAPSPTGFLHIGGARTALFNWLFARHHGGKMLLRIEDTDRERSTEAAVHAILDGLTWLGLGWDGDSVSQYSRVDRHREVAGELLARGHAYRCFCTPAELDEMRARAAAEGRPQRYDGTWRDRDPSEAPTGVEPAIRFRAPVEGETVVEDKVQGRVTFQNKELDDLIILRSDGNPTYNLSVVVDDHDMGITHIIRGVDHLTNAARQAQIYRAMSWPVPEMAHIPLIHGADGAKLSKRHGALGVEAYRTMGYLPEALRNYLARLGWSHGDDEVFSTEQMVAWFDLDHVGKSAARFDTVKLETLNGHYIRNIDDEALIDRLLEFIPHAEDASALPPRLGGSGRQRLLKAMSGLKARAKTLAELLRSARFLFEQPAPDDKARAVLDAKGLDVLALVLPRLEAAADWTAQGLEASARQWAEGAGLKLGQLAQPLRASITGSTSSPGIFEVMEVLGREDTLRRLSRSVGKS